MGGSRRDSLWIGCTADDQTSNTAWEFESDSTWVPFSDAWSNPNDENNTLDVTLWIFPFVSTSAEGCVALPVKLLSFNAERNVNDVQLSWQISDEMNMKGYEVEKADNNGIYRGIAFVPALNSLKNQGYNVTDKNAFTKSPIVQYRLKQIDGDGSVQYSRIITLKSSVANVVFPNPFTGSLRLQLNLSSPQTVAINIYDMQGRLVAIERPHSYNASTNIINIYGTANLRAGSYLMKLNVGHEQLVYKIVKQ